MVMALGREMVMGRRMGMDKEVSTGKEVYMGKVRLIRGTVLASREEQRQERRHPEMLRRDMDRVWRRRRGFRLLLLRRPSGILISTGRGGRERRDEIALEEDFLAGCE